jgi:hypothetical protein
MRNLAHKHWCEEGASEERQIGQRHAFTSLVHMIQIAHAGID